MSAREAALAMAFGIERAVPDAKIDLCPIADGGEGTVDAMLAATNGQLHETEVVGPLGDPVSAQWGMLGEREGEPLTAVIEMAAAAGLALVPPDRRDPAQTTTYGVGQLIAAALDQGAQQILIGIGGSATNDGGTGMAQALGVVFEDVAGNAIEPHMTGGMLDKVATIQIRHIDERLEDVRIIVACDVTNPLTGPNGAAAIYGPQKGATPEQVDQLDSNLRHLGKLLADQIGIDILDLPGSGAAGGLGGGMAAFLNALLTRGIDLVLDAVQFEQRVEGCDLCLTGEGRIDGQSLSGKACLGVAKRAEKCGVKTIALVGSAADDADRTLDAGLHAYHVIAPDLPSAQSMANGPKLLAQATEKLLMKLQ